MIEGCMYIEDVLVALCLPSSIEVASHITRITLIYIVLTVVIYKIDI